MHEIDEGGTGNVASPAAPIFYSTVITQCKRSSRGMADWAKLRGILNRYEKLQLARNPVIMLNPSRPTLSVCQGEAIAFLSSQYQGVRQATLNKAAPIDYFYNHR